MLALRKTTGTADSCTVNVLPCRINYTGPTKVTKRHWTPRTETDGAKVSYFRGRKLKGKTVQLPAGYTGLVVKAGNRVLSPPQTQQPAEADDNSDVEEIEPEATKPIKILESTSTFDNMVVWQHDQLPTPDDQFVKGIEEWLGFADAIHNT